MMTMHQLDHPLSGTPRTTRTGFWLGIFTVLLLDRLWEHIPIVGFMVVSYEADINIGSVPHLLQHDVDSQEHRFQLEALGE
ncbi:hypothetical protein Tco_0508095 [Tanacetum coccineum]